jgi:hypothetical protein
MKKVSFKRMLTGSDKGQSLVEMAIITPLLIFLLLGVFEVGWALRGYLVLVNVNREITRFSVRPGYLNFSTRADVITSYLRVRDWTVTSLSGQLNMVFSNTGIITNTGNTTLIVSHVVVDTGLPCEDINTNPDNCECDKFETDLNYGFALDDLIIHPNIPGMEYQRGYFGPTQTVAGIRATRIDFDDLLYNDNDHNGVKDDDDGLIPRNNKFNCELIKKGGIPSSNNLIITELFYDQPQLFGFPLISNPFTDPVPLYTHTTMRIVGAARSSGRESGSLTDDIDTIGPVCDAFPFVVYKDTIEYGTDNKLNQTVDIFDGHKDHGGGGTSNDYGWLAWNPGKTSEGDLEDELMYSTTSLNDFKDPVTADEHLGRLDNVRSITGTHTNVETSHNLVSALIGKKIRIPVWDTFSSNNYHIIGFAWIQIESSGDINLPGEEVKATYLGDAKENCP